jgi:hypothetical protein
MGLKMSDGDWFPVFRKIFDHKLWTECREITELMAWMWLIGKATHTDSSIGFRGVPVKIFRGQLATSYKSLAKSWRWSRGRVVRFLTGLTLPKDDPMIQMTWLRPTSLESLHKVYTIHQQFSGVQPELKVLSARNHAKTDIRTPENEHLNLEKTKRSLLVISIVKYPEAGAKQDEKRTSEIGQNGHQNGQKRTSDGHQTGTLKKVKKTEEEKRGDGFATTTDPAGGRAPRTPPPTRALSLQDPRATTHQRNGILVREKLKNGEFGVLEIQAWTEEAEREAQKQHVPPAARKMFVDSYIVKKGADRLGIDV